MDASGKMALEVEEVLLPVEEKIDEEAGELGIALKELSQLIRSFGTDLEPSVTDVSAFTLSYGQGKAIDMSSYSMTIPDSFVVEAGTDKDTVAWLPNPKCMNKKDKAIVTLQFGKERLMNVDGQMNNLAMGTAMQEQMYWNERNAGNPAFADTEFFPILTESVAGGCVYSFVNNHCKYVIGLCMDGRNQQISVDVYGVARDNESVVRNMIFRLMEGVTPKRALSTSTIRLDNDAYAGMPISKDSIATWEQLVKERLEENKVLLVKRIQVAMAKAQCLKKINAFSLSNMMIDLNNALDETASGIDVIFDEMVGYMEKISALNSENEDLIDVYEATRALIEGNQELSIHIGESVITSSPKNVALTIEKINTPALKVMMSEEKRQERLERERIRAEKEARLAKLREKYPGYTDEEIQVLELLEAQKVEVEAKVSVIDSEIESIEGKIALNRKIIADAMEAQNNNEAYRADKVRKIMDEFAESIRKDEADIKELRAKIKSKSNEIIRMQNEASSASMLQFNRKKEIQVKIAEIESEIKKLKEEEDVLIEKVGNEDSKRDARLKALDNDADDAKRKIVEFEQAIKIYEGQIAPKQARRLELQADCSQIEDKMARVREDMAAGIYDNILKR